MWLFVFIIVLLILSLLCYYWPCISAYVFQCYSPYQFEGFHSGSRGGGGRGSGGRSSSIGRGSSYVGRGSFGGGRSVGRGFNSGVGYVGSRNLDGYSGTRFVNKDWNRGSRGWNRGRGDWNNGWNGWNDWNRWGWNDWNGGFGWPNVDQTQCYLDSLGNVKCYPNQCVVDPITGNTNCYPAYNLNTFI